MRSVRLVAGLFAAGLLILVPPVGARPVPIEFHSFVDTGVRLTGIVWTGSRFIYVENTANTLWTSGPHGGTVRRFASMPNEVEETRCAVSPGTHGFRAGDLYCHAPDNTIYRISPDGSRVAVFARLPESSTSDGMLAFDTVGRFGYALLAATGRSGTSAAGGTVYAVAPDGTVRTVGTYAGPGGADEIAVAPARFGTGGGDVVVAIDAVGTGALVLMDGRGRTRTIATLPEGLNPIVVVQPASRHPPSAAAPGLYLAETNSHQVFFAPASQLAPYVGGLFVGSELHSRYWIVRPHGKGFRTLELQARLPVGNLNLESAAYVAG